MDSDVSRFDICALDTVNARDKKSSSVFSHIITSCLFCLCLELMPLYTIVVVNFLYIF
jgi:hypothetical protein